MNKLAKRKQKGFTLIELIAVIAIIGILAAVLVPKVLGYLNDAKRSKIQGQARTFVMAVDTYNSKEGTTLAGLDVVGLSAGAGSDTTSTTFSTFKGKIEAAGTKYDDYFDINSLDMLSDGVTYAQAKQAANGKDASGAVKTIDIKNGLTDGKWNGTFETAATE